MYQRPQTPFNHHCKSSTNNRFELSTRKKVLSSSTTPILSACTISNTVLKRSPWKEEARNTHLMIDDALKQVESLRLMIQSMKVTQDSSSATATMSNPLQDPVSFRNVIVSPSSTDDVRKSARESFCLERKSRKTILQYSSSASESLRFHCDEDLFSPLSSPPTFPSRDFPQQLAKPVEKLSFPVPEKIDQTTKDLYSLSLKLLPPNGKLTIQLMATDPLLSSPCRSFPLTRVAK